MLIKEGPKLYFMFLHIAMNQYVSNYTCYLVSAIVNQSIMELKFA